MDLGHVTYQVEIAVMGDGRVEAPAGESIGFRCRRNEYAQNGYKQDGSRPGFNEG